MTQLVKIEELLLMKLSKDVIESIKEFNEEAFEYFQKHKEYPIRVVNKEDLPYLMKYFKLHNYEIYVISNDNYICCYIKLV